MKDLQRPNGSELGWELKAQETNYAVWVLFQNKTQDKSTARYAKIWPEAEYVKDFTTAIQR